MQYGLSIDMLFNHIRAVSLFKNHLFFRLREIILQYKLICSFSCREALISFAVAYSEATNLCHVKNDIFVKYEQWAFV